MRPRKTQKKAVGRQPSRGVRQRRRAGEEEGSRWEETVVAPLEESVRGGSGVGDNSGFRTYFRK